METEQIVMVLFGLLSTISIALASWGLRKVEKVDVLQSGQTTLLANQHRLEGEQRTLEDSVKLLIGKSNEIHERLTATLSSLTNELQLVRLQLNGPQGSTGVAGDVAKLSERHQELEREVASIAAELERMSHLLDTYTPPRRRPAPTRR